MSSYPSSGGSGGYPPGYVPADPIVPPFTECWKHHRSFPSDSECPYCAAERAVAELERLIPQMLEQACDDALVDNEAREKTLELLDEMIIVKSPGEKGCLA